MTLLSIKCQRDLESKTKNLEFLSRELMSKNSKNIFLSMIYRPPDGDFKAFNTFLKDLYSFPSRSINVSMPPGTITLTFLTTTKMKNEISEFNI